MEADPETGARDLVPGAQSAIVSLLDFCSPQLGCRSRSIVAA
jgi:hypothetical protein